MLNFSEYQSTAKTTAVYPGQGNFHGLAYAVLGLSGEAGEVAEQVKKTWRNDNSEVTSERLEAIREELGDLLWYAAAVCNELGLAMGDVASNNLIKLQNRAKANTLKHHG